MNEREIAYEQGYNDAKRDIGALKTLNAELVTALSQLVYAETGKLCIELPGFIDSGAIEAVIAKAKGGQNQ